MIRKKAKGFSLIELMIVIAIVGILASIATPSYQTYIKKAKIVEVINMLSRFKVDITNSYQENGSFPTNLSPTILYRTNVWYPGLGTNVSHIYWANDPTSNTGRPKATLEARLTPELGGGLIYFAAIVNQSGIIEFHCGSWVDDTLGSSRPYMPAACSERDLMNM